MREVQDGVVVRRRAGDLEGLADGGPLLREVVDVRDDPEVFEDHLGAVPFEAVGAVVGGLEFLEDEDFGAEGAEGGDGGFAVVEVEVFGGAFGGGG